MTNPFENDDLPYVVLVNDLRQHSLWPAHLAIPAGWTRSHGPATRQSCLDHVETRWTDLTPERV
ncbi:MbtH protein [Allocatelliglobosispora scoriae]|uniref:MbtH protein n=1 Tax=Allocatelliglobosispora scoriae TaxID=643052 RepID=A0A841BJY1_9ACTN|nr:MbtH family protein [Allocatelliglobosispora scoriae]MBB5867082.1 MbtH protein [Allocatelliglobosispora scoriae]